MFDGIFARLATPRRQRRSSLRVALYRQAFDVDEGDSAGDE